MSKIDLNAPPPKHQFSISVEREESVEERRVRLFKDLAVFVVAVGFVVVMAYLCFSTLITSTASAEEKKWAMSVLSAATGGMIGYLIRK